MRGFNTDRDVILRFQHPIFLRNKQLARQSHIPIYIQYIISCVDAWGLLRVLTLHELQERVQRINSKSFCIRIENAFQ
jgi:hypothetical protein